MLLQNKRLFILVSVVILTTSCVALLLYIFPSSGIRRENTIPESPHLETLPPQANSTSEFTSTITNLPLNVTYTQTRNIQDTIAYLIDPNKKGSHYQANYRDDSWQVSQDDDMVSFLVDVPSVKKTFIVYNGTDVSCAPPTEQKEPDWQCKDSLQEGDFE